MPSKVFEAQAALLVRALPYVAAETCFALKGGTAINLFIRVFGKPINRLDGELAKSETQKSVRNCAVLSLSFYARGKDGDFCGAALDAGGHNQQFKGGNAAVGTRNRAEPV